MRGHYRDSRIPPLLLNTSKPQGHNPFQPTRHPFIHMPQPRHPPMPLVPPVPLPATREMMDNPLPNLLQKDAKGYLMNLPPPARCRAILTAINLFLFKHDSRGNTILTDHGYITII